MKRKFKLSMLAFVSTILVLFVGSVNAADEAFEGMKGIVSVKSVFDVRLGNPMSAALHLNLIHQTYRDRHFSELSAKPDFVVVFIGPSVKLISKNREVFSPEDNKFLDEIAATVSKMSKDGIRLEICLVAAKVFGVAPESVLPEIKHVSNGWISLIAYQTKGFALVPVY